jgi:hypothetical protein
VQLGKQGKSSNPQKVKNKNIKNIKEEPLAQQLNEIA